jgi:HK97 family phage major capsid protein
MSYSQVVSRGAGPTYSATPGTHPLIPENVSASIIKATIQKSAVRQLFKTRNMTTAQQRMPVLATKPVGYFVTGDTGLKQTTSLSWSNKFLDAEELAVIVPIPEKLLDDVQYDLWGEIKPELEEALGVALDAAVLFGYNKPASWPASIVAAAIAAGNTVTQTAQSATHDVADDINNVMAAVEADGYDVNGFFIRNSMKAELRGLRDAQHGFIFQAPLESGLSNTVYKGTIYGEKAVSSMAGLFEEEDTGTYGRAANSVKMIAGDWSQGILGIRQDLTWKMLDQSVITDGDGNIIWNLPQQDMVALRVVQRVAFQVPNPINRMSMAEASRYPFSVLRDIT